MSFQNTHQTTGVIMFRWWLKSALKLAKIKKADEEIVKVAALLHDIGRAKGEMPSKSKKSEHHISGAKIAKKYLQKIGYPADKTEKVIACILAHRGNRDDFVPQTIEEKIVANADAMGHLISFLDLYRNFVEDEGMERGTVLIRAKIDRDWNKKLSPPRSKKTCF